MRTTSSFPAAASHVFSRLFISLFCLSVTVAFGAPPPVESFFQKPVFSGAKLSPGGTRVAFRIRDAQSRARLAVLNLETMKSDVVASFKDADVGKIGWVNNDRLYFDLDVELTGTNTTDRGRGLFAVDADGSRFRQLVETTVSAIKDGQGEKYLPWHTEMWSDTKSREGPDVYVTTLEEYSEKNVEHMKLHRLNTLTGRLQEVASPLHSFDWWMGADDVVYAVMTQEKDEQTIQYRPSATAPWKKLAAFNPYLDGGLSPRYVAPDGKLYVEANAGGDKRALYVYDAASEKLGAKPVVASKDYDVHAEFVATRTALLGVRHHIDAEVTQWFDADMKALQAGVDKMLPNTSNRISVPLNGDAGFVLVEAFADVQPTVTYVLNKKTQKLIKLGAEQPAVDAKQMAFMDMVRYKTRDGLDIPAYLTLPRGAPKKDLPLVVLVHGGPYVRGSTWGWDPEVQFLASRGYAVLQPEFRGSTGFGDKHFKAGWKQWGRAMQDDIADGVKWAVAQGIANPQRVCIAGASYGGYATLMGLVNDGELYRCGVQWVGVSDINLMYSAYWSDISDQYKRYGMPQLVGDREKDAAQLKATSPIEQAARIKRPLLMAYGAFDARVPIQHGERMRDALAKAGNNDVEWVTYRDEGHGWRKLNTNVDFWTRVEKFLAKHTAAAK